MKKCMTVLAAVLMVMGVSASFAAADTTLVSFSGAQYTTSAITTMNDPASWTSFDPGTSWTPNTSNAGDLGYSQGSFTYTGSGTGWIFFIGQTAYSEPGAMLISFSNFNPPVNTSGHAEIDLNSSAGSMVDVGLGWGTLPGSTTWGTILMSGTGTIGSGPTTTTIGPSPGQGGEIGLIYNGTTVSTWYLNGNTWTSLGSYDLGGSITPLLTVQSQSADPVPLPSALLLFGPGLASLVAIRRRVGK